MPVPNSYRMPEPPAFELLPEDTYQCEISDVEVKQNKIYQSEEFEDVFNFTFRVMDGEYKNRKLWKKARMIMSAGWEKGSASWLYRIYCAATKQKISGEEAKKVSAEQINALIEKQVMLVVEQKPKKSDGSIVNNISGILPAKSLISANPFDDMGPVNVSKPQETDSELTVIADELEF